MHTRLMFALVAWPLLLAGAHAAAAADNVVSITLPEDHDSYRPGPNLEAVTTYCAICHAPDYVYMQPPLTRAQWEAEVKKMKAVFGCPLPDELVGQMTDYLVGQNGKK
jgi:mono/diheme cytochrome c family protein